MKTSVSFTRNLNTTQLKEKLVKAVKQGSLYCNMGATLGKCFVDTAALPLTGFGFVQVLFLAAAYAQVLFVASNMISDGSELLLLVPALAGIVGSVVLPVLGAVPDGAIVLFSGLGPDAQDQLNVGVGALAGSTIMLLTM